MIEQWEELAKRINRLLGSKLVVPLTGADMVWIVEAWKQLGKEGSNGCKT